MPRKCIIDECKKNVKWRVTCADVIHLCNDHAYLYAEDITKIVNNPCQTCVTEMPRRVREATFGPIVNGKRTRIYCKLHSPNHRSIKKKIVQHQKCIVPSCPVTASFNDGFHKKRVYCKSHRPTTKLSNNK